MIQEGVGGTAVPVAADMTVSLATLGYEQSHLVVSLSGRMAFAALALGTIVRCAARMPKGCPERVALAKAAEALREVV
jgi:hypothetical protein